MKQCTQTADSCELCVSCVCDIACVFGEGGGGGEVTELGGAIRSRFLAPRPKRRERFPWSRPRSAGVTTSGCHQSTVQQSARVTAGKLIWVLTRLDQNVSSSKESVDLLNSERTNCPAQVKGTQYRSLFV